MAQLRRQRLLHLRTKLPLLPPPSLPLSALQPPPPPPVTLPAPPPPPDRLLPLQQQPTTLRRPPLQLDRAPPLRPPPLRAPPLQLQLLMGPLQVTDVETMYMSKL